MFFELYLAYTYNILSVQDTLVRMLNCSMATLHQVVPVFGYFQTFYLDQKTNAGKDEFVL